jgi:hypothetical protein
MDYAGEIKHVSENRDQVLATIRSYTRALALASSTGTDIGSKEWLEARYRHARAGYFYMLGFAHPNDHAEMGALLPPDEVAISKADALEIGKRLLHSPLQELRMLDRTQPHVNLISGMVHAHLGSLLAETVAGDFFNFEQITASAVEFEKAERLLTLTIDEHNETLGDFRSFPIIPGSSVDPLRDPRPHEQIVVSRELAVAQNNRGVVRFFLAYLNAMHASRYEAFALPGEQKVHQELSYQHMLGSAQDFLSAAEVQGELNLVPFKNQRLAEEAQRNLEQKPTDMQLLTRTILSGEGAPGLQQSAVSLDFLEAIPVELDGSRTAYPPTRFE